jgi:ABC-type ATPase involved in cell division
LNGGQKIVELIGVSLAGKAVRPVLNNLDFSFSSGQTAIITGSTGSGKTSIVELIVGRRKPDSGTVIVFEKKLDTRNERLIKYIRRKIGGVGGIFGLLEQQTVYENLSYPLLLRNEALSRIKTKIGDIMAKFSLAMGKEEKVSRLSYGEKVLVMLARAVIADQPLILIDEPLLGLDPDMSARVTALMGRLALAGHSMIVFTAGQTAVGVGDACEYSLKDGRLT